MKQFFLTPLCIKCGSFFCETSLFCKTCFAAEIEPRIRTAGGSHIRTGKHFYLLDWHKKDSHFLDQMVYRMKSDNSSQAWAFYAKLLFQIGDIDFQKSEMLVPIPGSRPDSVHSFLFARELAILSGLPIRDILVKPGGQAEQKRSTLGERKNAKFALADKRQSEVFTKCIFVDDVLTTGQSYFQSNKAVNGRDENTIITLFYRPRE